MSMCQGMRYNPAVVRMFGGGVIATPDKRLARDLDHRTTFADDRAVKLGPSSFMQWHAYSLATEQLTVAKLYYDPAVPFLDWEMGLGTPFAGTYAPPLGLVAL